MVSKMMRKLSIFLILKNANQYPFNALGDKRDMTISKWLGSFFLLLLAVAPGWAAAARCSDSVKPYTVFGTFNPPAFDPNVANGTVLYTSSLLTPQYGSGTSGSCPGVDVGTVSMSGVGTYDQVPYKTYRTKPVRLCSPRPRSNLFLLCIPPL